MNSLGVFLGQEAVRFNGLVAVMRATLSELQKAIRCVCVPHSLLLSHASMRTVCLFLVPHALCREIVRGREKLMPAPPAREVQHATPIFEAKIENNKVDVHVTCSQPIYRLLIFDTFQTCTKCVKHSVPLC